MGARRSGPRGPRATLTFQRACLIYQMERRGRISVADRRIEGVRLTRFQYRRDRVIGDSQVRIEHLQRRRAGADRRRRRDGPRLRAAPVRPLPRPRRVRGAVRGRGDAGPAGPGRARRSSTASTGPAAATGAGRLLPWGEAVQVALWDLAAKQAGLPLWRLLGGERTARPGLRERASTSTSRTTTSRSCSGPPPSQGYGAFKIKVGHPDPARDLHRLDLLAQGRRAGPPGHGGRQRGVEPKETLIRVAAIQRGRATTSSGSRTRCCATTSTA